VRSEAQSLSAAKFAHRFLDVGFGDVEFDERTSQARYIHVGVARLIDPTPQGALSVTEGTQGFLQASLGCINRNRSSSTGLSPCPL